eukprot:5015177-Lingulodinium_polyedra.AAC.1
MDRSSGREPVRFASASVEGAPEMREAFSESVYLRVEQDLWGGLDRAKLRPPPKDDVQDPCQCMQMLQVPGRKPPIRTSSGMT